MNLRSEKRITPQRKLKTRLREVAADVILEAAEQAFAEAGPSAGMEIIAARAGVSVGTLYNHFRDKDALVDALVTARHNALFDRILAAVTASEGKPFRARLLSALEAVFSTASANERFRQVFLHAELRNPRKKGLLDRMKVAFGPVFAQGRRENELRPDPYDLQIVFLFALLTAGNLSSSDDALPRARVASVVLEQFLDGARRPGK